MYASSDRLARVAAIEPSPDSYFIHYYDYYPDFVVRSGHPDDYWDDLSYEPGGDPCVH